jgi:hypothetical protein
MVAGTIRESGRKTITAERIETPNKLKVPNFFAEFEEIIHKIGSENAIEVRKYFVAPYPNSPPLIRNPVNKRYRFDKVSVASTAIKSFDPSVSDCFSSLNCLKSDQKTNATSEIQITGRINPGFLVPPAIWRYELLFITRSSNCGSMRITKRRKTDAIPSTGFLFPFTY